jgi:hypothetical protein
MKISEAERKKYQEAGPVSMATRGPAYPYGLELHLDTEALEKLAINIGDLSVGDTLALVAKVEVTSISSNESQHSKPSESVGLQITEACLEDADTARAAAKALYAKDAS